MFLRAVWLTWLPPMENASPSPPKTKTWRSGLLSETPLANGKGNTQANRRGAQDTPAKRLEGVQI